MRLSKKIPDLTEGPLFFRLLFFAIPIMLTGLLQVFYNMADNVIVGKFSGDSLALAAVGCTGTATSVLLALIMGVAAGASIIVSQFYGAKNHEKVSESVHTAMTFSVIGGAIFCAIGLVIAEPFLTLLGTKPELLSRSLLYFRIICLGIPATAIYNFGASILRATGNSRVPLIILTSTGLANVLLNLLFVIAFKMSVSGVALATILSQYASAVAVVIFLNTREGASYRLVPSKLGIIADHLKRILLVGVPAGVQSATYSLGNLCLTAALNTFPTTTVTAVTIANNIDHFMLNAVGCFATACLTFVGQNYGAKKPNRIKRVISYTLVQTLITGLIVGSAMLLLSDGIISFYLPADTEFYAEITADVKTIIGIMLYSYIIYAFDGAVNAANKGFGRSMTSMIIGLVCICSLRVAWILFAFPHFGTLTALYFIYPVSYATSLAVSSVAFYFIYKKAKTTVFTASNE